MKNKRNAIMIGIVGLLFVAAIISFALPRGERPRVDAEAEAAAKAAQAELGNDPSANAANEVPPVKFERGGAPIQP